jgi:hypothetical protein
MQDHKRFASNMNGLAEIFGTELSELKLSFYAKVLERFTDEQVEKAVMMATQTLEFFPKPVQLIELIEGKSQDRAVMAWDVLLNAIRRHGSYQSVLFADPKITKTVELMGGWLQACSMTEDETKWRMADFLKIYQGIAGDPEHKALMGRYEQDNRMRGFLDRIPEPDRIGFDKPELLLIKDDAA